MHACMLLRTPSLPRWCCRRPRPSLFLLARLYTFSSHDVLEQHPGLTVIISDLAPWTNSISRDPESVVCSGKRKHTHCTEASLVVLLLGELAWVSWDFRRGETHRKRSSRLARCWKRNTVGGLRRAVRTSKMVRARQYDDAEYARCI